MAAAIVTAARVRELFHYSIVAGTFTRLIARRCRNGGIGATAGTVGAAGYVQINIEGRFYYAHRLAWLYLTGEWPENEIDHRNTDPAFNAWINLRDVTSSVNKQNRRTPRADSKSGALGVYWSRQNKGWCARIQTDGETVWLGRHDRKEEAYAAYLKAKRALHAGNTL